MLEAWYPQIKAVHITAALTSGSLFFLRGAAQNLLGAGWPKSTPVRRLSWAVDTVLLAAASLLMAVTSQFPGTHAWLSAKLALVFLYIVVGYFALGRIRSRALATGLWLAAIVLFLAILAVAWSHDPLPLELLSTAR